MLRNIFGPALTYKNVFCCCFLLVYFQKSSSFCEENEIFKNKKQKWTSFNFIKRQQLDQFLTLQHICYI